MLEHLSEIELYFSPADFFRSDSGKIVGDECTHIIKIMRHKKDDEIFVTNGEGKIYRCSIINISKNEIYFAIKESKIFSNNLFKIFFCIPILKSADRFEYALEKCVELGITNFIVFNSDRSIIKSNKVNRWNKILISAMKQSLKSYLPKIQLVNSLKDILSLDGEKIIFSQTSSKNFREYIFDKTRKQYFIFGPEGSFSDDEIRILSDYQNYSLTKNRLRTETAVVSACSILTILSDINS